MSGVRGFATVALESSFVAQAMRYFIRFRGLRVHPSTHVDVQGGFQYGRRVTVRRGCSVVVGESGLLSLADDVWLGEDVDLLTNERLSIGRRTTIQRRSTIGGTVKIGRDCLFAPNVFVSSGRHMFDDAPWLSIRDQERRWKAENAYAGGTFGGSPVVIDDDCWIGTNAVIVDGVRVGKGCVIGANSVVTKSLPPYSVAAGAPAKILSSRLRFEPPSSIEFGNDLDRPYFYDGVDASDASASEGTRRGGWPTDSAFALAVPNGDVRAVKLRVSADLPEAELICNGQVRRIATHPVDVEFDLLTDQAWQPRLVEFRASRDGIRFFVARAEYVFS